MDRGTTSSQAQVLSKTENPKSRRQEPKMIAGNRQIF